MTKEQKLALKKLIEVSEEFNGARVIIDYVGLLLEEFKPGIIKEFDKLINEEYRRYDN